MNKIRGYFLLLFVLALTPCHVFALESVTLQLKWYHQFQFAGYYAAKSQGYYAEAGLDVNILAAQPELNPIEQVVSGKANYGVGSSSLLLAFQQKKPVKLLAVIFQHSPYVLLAKQDGDISSIHDAVGKRLMLEPIADELIAYIKKEGIDLSLLQQLPHSLTAESLISGDTDLMSAYITDEPFLLDQKNISYSAFSPRSVGIDFYGDNLFTSSAEIKNNPERVKAFRQASLRGWQYALSHQDEIIDLILQDYEHNSNREKLVYEAEKMKALIHPELIKIGYILPERWQHIASTYSDLGMLPKDVDLDGFIYNSDPEIDLTFYYWQIGIALLIIIIISTIAWHFIRLNKALDNLLYLKNQHENIGEAINNISHQWKQPLNNLGFQLMRIEQMINSDSGNRYEMLMLVTRGQDTLQFMADTVETFRNFLSTKRQVTQFNPNEIIEQSLSLLHDNFELNSITVQKKLSNHIKLTGSSSEFSHTLLSLLINARDAIQSRNIKPAEISLEMITENEMMILTIHDNAGGIFIEPINNIFDMGISTKMDSDAGVGLFIAKKIITKSFSGTIQVQNKKDGAEFTIKIPTAK